MRQDELGEIKKDTSGCAISSQDKQRVCNDTTLTGRGRCVFLYYCISGLFGYNELYEVAPFMSIT